MSARHSSPSARRRAALALSSVLALALAACGDSPAPVDPAPGDGGSQNPLPVRVVTQVEIEVPTETPLLVEGTRQLRARLRAGDGTPIDDQRPIWRSSDPAVAEVTPEGVVFARAVGETVISAAAGTARAERRVVVAPVGVARIEISVARVTLAAGATHAFGAVTVAADGRVLADRALTWRSSHDAILAVNADGRVRGLRPGRALVVVESEGQRATAEVTVTEGVIGEAASTWTMRVTELVGSGVRCTVGPVGLTLQQVGDRIAGQLTAGARVECAPIPGAQPPFVTPTAPHGPIEGTIDPDGRTIRLHATIARWTLVGTLAPGARALDGTAWHLGPATVTEWGSSIAPRYEGRFAASR